MADIVTNTLQIGSNNLILQDADAQAKTSQILNSAYVTDTASGSLASFPDGADNVPVKSLKVNVEPVQDLHGYENPWPAGGGKNKLPFPYFDTTKTQNGVTFTVNSDGTVTVQGTATANTSFGFSSNLIASMNLSVGDVFIVTDGTTYDSSSCYSRLLYADTSAGLTRIQNSYTLTVDSGMVSRGLNFQIWVPSGTSLTTPKTFKPMIRLSSVADAAYAPYENICPISGHTQAVVKRTGKNFIARPTWQTFTKSGVTATLLDDGQVSVSGTGTNTGFDIITFSSFLLPAGSYIFNGQNGVDPTNQLLTLQLYNKTSETQIANKSTASDYAFSLTKESLIEIRIGLRVGVSVTNAIMSPMIRLATDTDATYEPYSGQQYTIDLGGTIYGGTLDVTTGALANKSEYKTLSTSNWTRLYDNQCVYYTTDQSKAIGANNIISDMFKTDINRSNNSISGSASTRGIYVRDDSCTTLEEFKTKYPTVNVLLERATHQTVQLSANEVKTLLGQNNIWSDTGTVDVEYRADTKLYINKLTGITG